MKSSKRPAPPWQVILIPLLILAWGMLACSTGPVAEPVAGDWIAIYFTAPRYPDEPADHTGGIDTHLVTLIDSAQARIDVAAYDLDLESVTDALIQAHEDGLQVRLVTDGTNADQEAIDRLRAAQIPVVARPENDWGIMHNKFVVVDGNWVWTGSWNLTDNGTYRNNNNSVLIASRSLAQNYTTEFEEMFSNQFGGSSPADTPYPQIQIDGQGRPIQVEVYFAPEDGAADRLLQVLNTADSHVRFLAFVFTSQPLADGLINLAERGITVQGVVEDRSAETPYSQVSRLQAGGVDVLTDGNPYVMHHKLFIVDDQIVVLGSYNFTASAEEDNDENLLIIHDPEVAAAFLAEFGRVLQDAQ